MKQVLFDGCFVCGPDNRCGLNATFRTLENGEVEGIFTPKDVHCGYDGIVHGGVVMGFLDETLGRLSFAKDRLFLTHTLEVSFRQAAAPDVPLRAVAHLKEWKKRQFITEGTVFDSDGEIIATAKGRFLVMSEKMERDLLPEDRRIAGKSPMEKP
ncbi:MAG TPA: PaaI family thioesterase [Proteobacteria bacterium]|nr:thioesterase superfamily protein [bacterium BMS3Abin14]HDL53134.1 PaaI family thioesterase [Pseudomonadota bacterium]